MSLLHVVIFCLITFSINGSTDVNTLVANFSTACQLTHDKCTNVNIKDCHHLEGDILETPAYWCYVLWGFCTDHEFANLISSLCNMDMIFLRSSQAKLHFYRSIDNVSDKCGQILSQYISLSVVLLLMKTEENYCLLMTANLYGDGIEYFVVSEEEGCSNKELELLQQEACVINETVVNQNFSNSISRVTPKCQNKIGNCFDSCQWKVRSLIVQRYCDILNDQEDNVSIMTCLERGGDCTQAEMVTLNVAPCETSHRSDITAVRPTGSANVSFSIVVSTATSNSPPATQGSAAVTTMSHRLHNSMTKLLYCSIVILILYYTSCF